MDEGNLNRMVTGLMMRWIIKGSRKGGASFLDMHLRGMCVDDNQTCWPMV